MAITRSERKRLQKLTLFENEARQQGHKTVAGVDEAGRGPLAGPVVAAVCIIPEDLFFPGINDSKQLLPKARKELFQQLTSNDRVQYAVGIVCHQEIDRINIYQATIQAMLQAIGKLLDQPDMLLVDGLALPHPTIPCQKIIQGDAKSQSIAAASVIAKETRDLIMTEYHEQWPEYGFNQHKGYCTEMHLAAINKHGPCPIHRKSFEPIKYWGRLPDPDLFAN